MDENNYLASIRSRIARLNGRRKRKHLTLIRQVKTEIYLKFRSLLPVQARVYKKAPGNQ